MIKDYIDCSDYNNDDESIKTYYRKPLASERYWVETRIQKHGDNWLNRLTGKFTPYRKD